MYLIHENNINKIDNNTINISMKTGFLYNDTYSWLENTLYDIGIFEIDNKVYYKNMVIAQYILDNPILIPLSNKYKIIHYIKEALSLFDSILALLYKYQGSPYLEKHPILSITLKEELEHLEKQIRYTNNFLSGSVSINPNIDSSLYLLDNIVRISHFKDNSKNLLNHIYKMLSIITSN